MSTLSQDIQISFSNVLKVYEDISTLLQDADAFMEKAGYKCLHSNYIGTESSKHIASPRYWVYPYVCRYYTSAAEPAIIKAIGVILLNPDRSATLPVILIGTFISTGNPSKDSKFHYYYLSNAWFRISAEREFNHAYQVAGLDYLETGVIKAFPIDAVSDNETLKEKILQPLLAMDHHLESQ